MYVCIHHRLHMHANLLAHVAVSCASRTGETLLGVLKGVVSVVRTRFTHAIRHQIACIARAAVITVADVTFRACTYGTNICVCMHACVWMDG